MPASFHGAPRRTHSVKRSDLFVAQLLLLGRHLKILVSVADRLDQKALPGSPGTTAGAVSPPASRASRESTTSPPFDFSAEWL